MPNHLNFYQTLEECKQKLEGTIVTYDGIPAFIKNIQTHNDGVHRLNIVMLPEALALANHFEEDEDDVSLKGCVRKKINSPKFNRFRPFDMGYCNYFDDGDANAKYLSRVPVRRSRQGLTQESLNIRPMDLRNRGGVMYTSIVENESFRDCVIGDFPKFEETMDVLCNDSSIGVGRDFAIQRDEIGLNFLYHKCEKVGVVKPREVQLANKFSYLREKIIGERNLPNMVVSL